jgi:hypothetical protein
MTNASDKGYNEGRLAFRRYFAKYGPNVKQHDPRMPPNPYVGYYGVLWLNGFESELRRHVAFTPKRGGISRHRGAASPSLNGHENHGRTREATRLSSPQAEARPRNGQKNTSWAINAGTVGGTVRGSTSPRPAHKRAIVIGFATVMGTLGALSAAWTVFTTLFLTPG